VKVIEKVVVAAAATEDGTKAVAATATRADKSLTDFNGMLRSSLHGRRHAERAPRTGSPGLNDRERADYVVHMPRQMMHAAYR